MVDIQRSLKQFLGKVISNPITLGIVMYLVWQIVKKYIKKEGFEGDNMKEEFKQIAKKNNKELVFDSSKRVWAVVINGRDIKDFGTDERSARKFFGESYSEKLNRLCKQIKGGN